MLGSESWGEGRPGYGGIMQVVSSTRHDPQDLNYDALDNTAIYIRL